MKIYLDFIMILNFIIDFVLLLTVSIVLKRNIKIKNLLYGSFIGGLSILFLFLNINNILLTTFKIIISILMVLVTFKYKNIKYTLINWLYLYFVGILLGGFIYFLNIKFSYKHIGLIFINKGLSINVIFLLIFTPIIIYIYIKQNKLIKQNYSNYYKVKIVIKNKEYDYIGYMDTGNNLIDTLTKKPIILIDKRKLLFNIKYFRLVPYSGVEEGLIKVIKVDKLIINNHEYLNMPLGIINKINLDGVDIILNNKLEA